MSGVCTVLIGPPGVGKTTVGALVAHALGLPHLDTDAMVAHSAGVAVSDIFIDQGEAAFRLMERDAVRAALTGGPAVVSLGGGAVLNEDTQHAVSRHFSVYLSGSLRQVSRRAGFDQGRPLLALNPRGQWLTLMEQRRPIYERLASLHVDTDDLQPSEVADRIVRAVHEQSGGHGH